MIVVQIGTNNAEDDVYKFVMNNKEEIDTLILVEPLTKFNDIVKDKYRDITNLYVENCVIVDSKETELVTFYITNVSDGDLGQISSLDRNHILKHGNFSNYEYKAPCMTISELFDKYNLSKIDHLFIDAEGWDAKIVESINFNKYNILTIEYENLHINSGDLASFLRSKNYAVYHGVGENSWSDRAIKK